MEENNNVNVAPEKTGKGNVNSNAKKKKTRRVKSKISKFIILAFVLIVVIVVGVAIFKSRTGKVISSNNDYLENMKVFGFDLMYDNKTATPSENVTKSEAVKMVITSMLNESNILNLLEVMEYVKDYNEEMTIEQIEEKLEYKNQLWVEYAINTGMLQKNEITKENANEKVTLLETLVYFANAKIKLLYKTLDTQVKPDIANYDSYTVSQQLALSDMIYNGMVDNNASKLDDKLTKERLNKLIIDMALKYNTITVGEEKINISKDKIPSNANEYPYTLASVEKSTYELKNYKVNDEYKNPKEVYVDAKKLYYSINNVVKSYMNLILNVDYANFDEEDFTNKLLDLSYRLEDKENVKEYVDYVKSNQIKLTGTAKVQYPAIYFDGESYRVRTKVEYKIEHANVKENLIYGDLRYKDTVKYSKDADTIIVDIPVQKSVLYDVTYVTLRPFVASKAGSVKADKEVLKQRPISEEEAQAQNAMPKTEDIKYTESTAVREGNKLVIKCD